MYICKECGTEYKQKPDYCDCGNDTFDEIQDTVLPKSETITKNKLETNEILSRFIFGLCLVLSFLVLLFFPKIDEQKNQNKNTNPKQANIVKQTNSNIPSLESFWINNKPVEPEVVEEKISPVEQIKEIFVKPKTNPQKQNIYTSTKKEQPKKNNNTTTPKPVVKQQAKSAPSQTTNPTKTTSQTTQTTQTTTKRQTSVPKSNMYELVNYKNQLRSRLLSNLRFSQVQGSGECGIEFSIDSSGKLLNRNFSYQSDNKSINDEVYKMLMRTSYFLPPPEAYKGEKIKMVFRINNTNYSIDYVR